MSQPIENVFLLLLFWLWLLSLFWLLLWLLLFFVSLVVNNVRYFCGCCYYYCWSQKADFKINVVVDIVVVNIVVVVLIFAVVHIGFIFGQY